MKGESNADLRELPRFRHQQSKRSLDLTFSALSDPTRRAILTRLSKGESSVTELARPFSISLPAISKHLDVLEEAKLIVRRKDGRVSHCRIEAAPLMGAAGWLAAYKPIWEKQLDYLAEYLREAGKDTED